MTIHTEATTNESDALYELLDSLPLMDDPFLRMQCQNIALVNAHIIDVEQQMYNKYIADERTPVQEAIFTSALSQMWIFALYELIRTWRQRVRELLDHSQNLAAGKAQATTTHGHWGHDANVAFLQARTRAEHDQVFLKQMQDAQGSLELVFRELEGVRITLAKHEIPKSKGIKAAHAGYARIDSLSGSMNYQFIDKDGSYNMCSRRSIVQHVLRSFSVAVDNTQPQD
jgi:hypothetical protein